MVLTHVRAYHRPGDLEAAWALVRDGGDAVRLLAGGTDLVAACPPAVRELVDLQDAGLDAIAVGGDGAVRIGAMATFTALLEHPGLARLAGGVLAETLAQVGSVLHRNSATVGGHLARGRLSDVIPTLLALDARVVLYAGERRELALRDYYAQRPGAHVLVEVLVPALPARSAAAFQRFSRAAFDHALVNGCCRVDLDERGRVSAARVVVGETATLGTHLPAVEAGLVDRALTPATIAAAAAAVRAAVDMRGDWVASAAYRRHLAGVVVQRCLETAAARLDGGAA
jgi:aerobic carbon-monoxide dehydrogenase medium subunit